MESRLQSTTIIPHDNGQRDANWIMSMHVLLHLYNDSENLGLETEQLDVMYHLIKDYCALSGFTIVPINDGSGIGIKLPVTNKLIIGSALLNQ